MLNCDLFQLKKGIKAILLMGGTGLRFGSETPKQFHRLSGKKIYQHTLETFLDSKLFDAIILVCPTAWIPQVKADIDSYPPSSIFIIEGGISRQESSFKGLLACGKDTRIVVIHDAVRPFLSFEILKENIEKATQYKAVDTCIASADTLVHTLDKEQITHIPHRAEYFRGQTPQSFDYDMILQAHCMAQEKGISNHSDDCSLILKAGYPVHIVMGSEKNIKITSELDLFLAEQILRLNNITSTQLIEQHKLTGKRIAVTGGTGGIGTAICKLLEEEGAIPISISRSSPQYPADLTSYSQTIEVFERIFQDYGQVDGLINCLGLLKTKQLHQLSSEEIDLLINTNLTGVIYSCKSVRLKSGGHIVNIASSSYVRGKKDYSIYACAKAAVVNFTQGLSEERKDLFVNALVPQRTRTAMRQDNFPDENPSTLLTPQEVAKETLRLLKQSSMTGTLVEVKQK